VTVAGSDTNASGIPSDETVPDETVEHPTRVDRLWNLLTHQHANPNNPKQVRSAQRLTAYENKTAWTMVILSIVYLVLYSVYVLDTGLSTSGRSLLNLGMNTIWVIFIIDLVTRALLAPRPVGYLVHHPIDVIAVAIPALRVLRVLRVLTAGQWLISRGSRLRFGRTATAVVIAFIFVTYLASLAVLNAERGAPGAKIETFPDSLWWSIVTMSTVGYGEYYPVTTNGRIIAAGVMVVGISLLGLVGASVASSVVSRLSGQAKQGQSEIRDQMRQLTQEVAALRQQLSDAGIITRPVHAADPSDDQHAQQRPGPSAS
jgi:voltage-gated potassium channel